MLNLKKNAATQHMDKVTRQEQHQLLHNQYMHSRILFIYLLSHPMFGEANSKERFKLFLTSLQQILPSFRWLNQTNCGNLFLLLKKRKPDSQEHQLYLFTQELQYRSVLSDQFLTEKIVPKGTFTQKYSGGTGQ